MLTLRLANARRPRTVATRWTALAALLLPTAAHAATGGPDASGYTWRDSADGAVYTPLVPSPATTFSPPDDAIPTGPLAFPFPCAFPFYGRRCTSAWITDNGWLDLEAPAIFPFPTPLPIPTAGPPDGFLAPLWTDLDCSAPGGSITYGPVPSIDGWMATWSGRDTVTGLDVVMDCILFADGRIRFQYRTTHPIAGSTIGIESFTAIGGLQVAGGGSIPPGVAITPGYAIEFRPPSSLASACASIPTLPCASVTDSLPGTFSSNATTYGCSPICFDVRERAYAITLPDPEVLTLTLGGGAGPGIALFLLDACDELSCVLGPVTSETVLLSAGTYYVVVDARTSADEGPFTLDTSCRPIVAPITFGVPTSGTTFGGPLMFSSYPCAAGDPHDGPEALYSLDVTAPTSFEVTLSNAPAGLGVFIVGGSGSAITSAGCVAWSDTRAFAWNASPGRYYVVVDGRAGAAGSFDLVARRLLGPDCTSPAGAIDFSTGPARAAWVRGDTSSAVDRAQAYSCDAFTIHDAGEDLYAVDIPQAGQLTIHPTLGSRRYYLLSSCDEGTCLGSDRCATRLAPGRYWLVVDGPAPGEAYEAVVVLEDELPRWSACEDPVAPTQAGDTSRATWSFDDGAFCVSDPASRNNPAGCTFALYAAVPCGTTVHFDLLDAEGGRVRVFDVMRGDYVSLTARSSGGWFQEGLDIAWQDAPCPGPLDESAPETIVDIEATDLQGLRGLYRIELVDMGGYLWRIQAGCGDMLPRFELYDSPCAALAGWSPLPGLTMVGADIDLDCADAEVTYTIQNTGCAPVTNLPVELFDGPSRIAGDVVDRLAPGETTTRTFSAILPASPSELLRLAADDANLIVECEETPTGGCGLSDWQNEAFVPTCVSCEPARLPSVGGSLRLGDTVGCPHNYGPDHVLLQWASDGSLTPELHQHFHVLRSDRPASGFSLLAPDRPRLMSASYRDFDAAQPDDGTRLLCYLVFVVDACENEKRPDGGE